jgi:Transposase DDE domain
MRGADAMQENLFTVAKLEDFVPSDHPLRAIGVLVNDALAAMNARFNEIYAESGRDSIAPQKLIRALLLQVGRRHADSGRGRARRAFGPRMAAMISARVAVDATRRPIGKASRAATTPMPAPPTPDARLYRKSHNTASILCYQGHALMENRNGLVVSAVVTHADSVGERRAALAMLDVLPSVSHRRSIGADKAYDTRDFIAACRERHVTPHVACNVTRRGGSAIDARTTRHAGYRVSQIIRKRIEESFGWAKTVGRIRQPCFAGCSGSISNSSSP